MKGIFQGLAFVVIWAVALVLSFGSAVLPLGFLLFLTFQGAEARAAKASASLRSTLMHDEELLAEGLQHRIFALWSRRLLVAITSSRVMVIKRGILGGFKMQDIQWKDLTDAKIEQNVLSSVCGSNLIFKHSNRNVGIVDVDGIENYVASEIYAKAQSEEQAWEEKRRVRSMEEVRAAAGGVIVHTGSSQASVPSASSGNQMLEEIEKAKQLFDMGAISDAEYQEMKSKILAAA